MKNLFLAIILGYSLLFTAGCALHTIDIQQGNVITDEMLGQLKEGLSRQQVKFIMGSPILQDPFHADRWDYIYTLKPGEENRITVTRHVSLLFEQDKLAQINTRIVEPKK